MSWHKRIKHRLPTREYVVNHKYLGFLGDHLHDYNLWHFNRRSVARGVFIGLFCSFLPMPVEMIPAAVGAILFRANLPIAIALVWISNPLTWIPLWGPPYMFGAHLLGVPVLPVEKLLTEILSNPWDALTSTLAKQYAALWVGCVLVGTVLSLIAYFAVDWMWRARVVKHWRNRRTVPKQVRSGSESKPG